MINPWIWYIVNGEMPDSPTLEYREIGVVCVWLLCAFLWAAGMYLAAELIGFGNENFTLWFMLTFTASLTAFVLLSVWLLPKALDRAYRKAKEKELKKKKKKNIA